MAAWLDVGHPPGGQKASAPLLSERCRYRDGSYTRDLLESAVAELRRPLQEAFAQAREEHLDKKTVRLDCATG